MFPKVEQKRKGVLVQQVRYLVPCPGTRKSCIEKQKTDTTDSFGRRIPMSPVTRWEMDTRHVKDLIRVW